MKTIRVSAASNPNLVAGAIAAFMRERGRARAQAVGAAAINQTVKAIAIAREMMVESGADVICWPMFVDVIIDGQQKTAILFSIELDWPDEVSQGHAA